ncbi:MAG: heme biosynthesis HemY N-terminal domain-containing protein [Gammaproteobacteria bacterium]
MKKLIIIFLLLLATTWAGLALQSDTGYVLIAYKRWTLEATLATAVLSVILLALLLLIIMQSSWSIWTLNQRWHVWFTQRRQHRAQSLTQQGLIALGQAQWREAEKQLIQAVNLAETPLMNFLAAACAAQFQGNLSRRNRYLSQANIKCPQAEFAIDIVQANLHIVADEIEQALIVLQRLQQRAGKHVHPIVLWQLARLYQERGDWRNLQVLLPYLDGNLMLNKHYFQSLQITTYSKCLLAATNSQELAKYWQDIPRELCQQSSVVFVYCQQLIRYGELSQAEQVILKFLKKQWDEALMSMYCNLELDNVKQRITVAEGWLKNHTSATLLLNLGKLYLRLHLWGKAQNYFEKSIALDAQAGGLIELAKLHQQLNQPQQALRYYQQIVC